MIEWVVFGALAAAVVASGAAVVLSRNAVHAALALVVTLLAVAGLFVLQQAHFLAAVQVIVYAGAIVVLFLFVIMLLGVDREELLDEPLRGQRPAAVLFGVALLAELVLVAGALAPTGERSVRGSIGESGRNVARLAESLFTDFLFPFEVTSLLLVVAVVGGLVLARRRTASEAPTGPARRRSASEAPTGPTRRRSTPEAPIEASPEDSR